MSYLHNKTIEHVVVPVRCDLMQGTAFFINKKQLLTARHVVCMHIDSKARPAIKIDVAGKELLCTAVDLSIDTEHIDLALLTIDSGDEYSCVEPLNLLSDKYVQGLELCVYGYPQEVAMGSNLVEIPVQNGLEIIDGEWGDRALKRGDGLSIRNYDGLSGSPVVNESGRVVGVIVVQFNETLNYLSISKAKEFLEHKDIHPATNWEIDDMTTTGEGHSLKICNDAIKTIPERYTPWLHQENRSLEFLLASMSDKRSLDESEKKALAFADSISKLPDEILVLIQQRLEAWIRLTSKILTDYGNGLLKRSYDYIKTHPFQFVEDKEKIRELYELVDALEDDDFERLFYKNTRNVCLIGKAGSGKTHHLCDYALHNQDKANIYLFLGTDFTSHQSAIDHILETVCREMKLEDFNEAMKKRDRYAVIVIDAINEGLGCNYWNNQLRALREELNKYDHIRLVVSIRIPFDSVVNDLSDGSEWLKYEIEGFQDKEKAIDDYFAKKKISPKYKKHNIEAFKNPLFLKIFCETFRDMTEEEREQANKYILYKRYVASKNVDVSAMVDEDLELNIADRYLSTLAHYSVYEKYFLSISRNKARRYAKRIAPYRLWSNDLLNACLTTNLLLEDRSLDGESAVMFEYENLGDYYKAEVLLLSKMDIKKSLQWIVDERSLLKRKGISSEKFENAVKALFDIWYHKGEIGVYDERSVQKGGALHDLYYDFLMESDVPPDDLVRIILKLDKDAVNPIQLTQSVEDITYEEVEEIHTKLLNNYPTIADRDLVWTCYINRMYEKYGDDYFKEFYLEPKPTVIENLDERKFLIGITWMLCSSHPKLRAVIIRKIKSILQNRTSSILWLIDMFKDVNDMYVLNGLYCAICGVVLPSRDKELVADIAAKIYAYYYEREEAIPQDLIVRQWTLKIIERAYYLDNNSDYWKLIVPPFKPIDFDLPINEQISRSYFGLEQGSMALYHSMFDNISDFRNYIIGYSNRNTSNDYFVLKDSEYVGVLLDDIKTNMARYILHKLGWCDKLGYYDNGKYSKSSFNNDRERIGKKYQWLAWYWVNAHLMDSCKTSKSQYYYKKTIIDKEIASKPYPWNSSKVSRFDPTLDARSISEYEEWLHGVGMQSIRGLNKADWISNNAYLPTFRWLSKDENLRDYVMLIGDDRSQDGETSMYLYSNACFVDANRADEFANWAKKIDFYGQQMPERHGNTEFLWNEYPWADSYTSLEHDNAYQADGYKYHLYLSYEAQLQENWDGLDDNVKILSTAYMPCAEMMDQMGLYCSEIRGVIKDADGNVAAINTSHDEGISGLFIRRDILNEYLERKNYTMFYYVLGQKYTKVDNQYYSRGISAAYQYNPQGDVIAVQPVRVIKSELPKRKKKVNKKKRITELQKKNDEEGLTQREAIELATLKQIITDEEKPKE